MSAPREQSALVRMVLKQLAHPLKLRLALTLAAVAAWQVAVLGPVGEQVAATTTTTDRERKRVATAREVEQLRKSLAPHARLVSPSDDVHEMVRRVLNRIRSSPLRLIDLKPEKPGDLGPFAVIGVHVSVEGTYAEIDDFLGWVEAEKIAMAAESIKLAPLSKEPGRLSAQITVKALAERTADPAKTKAETKKKP